MPLFWDWFNGDASTSGGFTGRRLIRRVNRRVALYKRAHESILEKPKMYDEGQGWISTDEVEGVMEHMYSRGPVLPTSLVDFMNNCGHEHDKD